MRSVRVDEDVNASKQWEISGVPRSRDPDDVGELLQGETQVSGMPRGRDSDDVQELLQGETQVEEIECARQKAWKMADFGVYVKNSGICTGWDCAKITTE